MKHIFLFLLGIIILTGCDSAQDCFDKAEILSKQGKHEEAIEMLDKSLAKDPKFLKSYVYRGIKKYRLGDNEGANADFQTLLNNNPKNTIALFFLGVISDAKGDFVRALEFYDKAYWSRDRSIELPPINLDPFFVEDGEIFFAQAMTKYKMGDFWNAYHLFNEARNNGYPREVCNVWVEKSWAEVRAEKGLAPDTTTKKKLPFGLSEPIYHYRTRYE